MSDNTFDPGDVWFHHFTDVHASATFGRGTKVWAFATVCANVTTGTNCAIGGRVYVGRLARLGDDVRVQDGAHLTDRIQIGSRVFIGPGAVTMNDAHPRVHNPLYRAQPPIIEDDATIGAGSCILPGVRIGRGATVGAGAVVTHNVPPYATVVGCPAREVARKSEAG